MNTQHNTVLITGGGTGIGFEIAKQFSEQGNKVIIAARNAERLNKAAAQLKNVTAIACDLTNDADFNRLVEQIKTSFGDLNILVNNSGLSIPQDITQQGNVYENAKKEIDLNYLAPIRLIEQLLPVLKKQPQAAIINVTSIVTLAPWALAPTYSGTKAALQAYTRLLRLALQGTNVQVMEVLPPLTDTDMTTGIDMPKFPASGVAAATLEGLANNTEVVRAGATAQFYDMFLQSPDTAFNYINGVQ
ncbi:SDR family NAD(P)-dependent oxidoreductase [Chitinophaga agrisoli]|uniref:SDR family NAD(P)-dependent oxidoreductase n=1 Tax=Chitinophaga agrisoli TaxID=2607653 RepID=A0A5B2VRA2_9BACT|nr:SDR family NAD(P)-dependent oxidoreductase [Chitinophaga agrisoli]KAA2240762.1 SDR family NAD(P)-dependent oxidoreductase [Chitinophaga agrisoli]